MAHAVEESVLKRFGGKGMPRSMAGFYQAFLQLSDTDRMTLSTNQTTNLANGDHVEFDVCQRNKFVMVNGVITLPADRVFRLTAACSAVVNVAAGRIAWQWRDVTNNVLIGNESLKTLDATILSTTVSPSEALVDTASGSVDVRVEFVNNSQIINVAAERTYAIIQQAGLSVLEVPVS